ncbi:uncharacterized protein [Clytia hemisphaerica]|uniref:uncharacterized protein n=1 Tax=Clytia hemisphaerica TaxID=252671 RepID=UPI0034D4F1E8
MQKGRYKSEVISSDSLSKSSKVQDVLPNVTLECGNVTPSGSKPKNTQLTQLVNKFTPSTVKNGPLFKEPSASVLTSGQSEQTSTPPSKEFFTVGNNVMKQLHPRTPHILLTDDDILKLRIASKNLKEWRPFVNELLSMKFTKEELAMSSAEGKENRKTKTSKPALNPFIIKELIAYTTTKWPYKKAEGDKPAEGCSESLCKRTINNKCGSARKLPKQKNDA